MWEVKRIQNFYPRDIESCHLAAARRVKLWSLNTNLFSKEYFGAYRHCGLIR